AWEDTFMNWDAVTKLLVSYPKSKLEESQMICESLHRTIGKRRASHQSTEHELEDQVNEWANMTGFLCALGACACSAGRPPRPLGRWCPPRGRPCTEGGGGSGTLTSLDARTKGGGATAGVAGGGGGGMLTPGQDIQFCPVTQFVGQLLRLLVCHNEKFGTQIQKHVKDLVAHEMSPTLYPILFDQIKAIVEKFFDPPGTGGRGTVFEAGRACWSAAQSLATAGPCAVPRRAAFTPPTKRAGRIDRPLISASARKW
ncbi:hypothetical protein MTO96_040152, partial [Rhipicephalus appendiculatus]